MRICDVVDFLSKQGLDVSCASYADAPGQVREVVEDSRRVTQGALFVAVQGEHVDGHDFAAAAVKQGAVAVLGDRVGEAVEVGVPYIATTRPREAAALLAHRLAGDPSCAMTVIGITGTNGKSSTACLTQAVLRHVGYGASNFGTMGYEIAGEMHPAAHTTPFGQDLAVLFARARAAGETHVVMEVSSHALAQERVAGIDFDVAAFTNLTQDHLDYHGDMGAYREAKMKLFSRVSGEGRFGVVNADDLVASHFMSASQAPVYTYGDGGESRALEIETGFGGTRFVWDSPWGKVEVRLNLLGRHNVWNALCAATICGGLGIPVDDVAAGLGALACVPGRFEAVDCGQDFFVIVDYAHTDDGLLNVLRASREMCQGRVITVFGCGGDRDRGKRPKMGKVAMTLSDRVFLTSDNPRSEDPARILLDAAVGLQQAKGENYWVVEDRAEAIRRAIAMAEPGDLVMIAGKGHEDYQILGDKRIHFDDREVARAILKERG